MFKKHLTGHRLFDFFNPPFLRLYSGTNSFIGGQLDNYHSNAVILLQMDVALNKRSAESQELCDQLCEQGQTPIMCLCAIMRDHFAQCRSQK